jgi:hypothetical protein
MRPAWRQWELEQLHSDDLVDRMREERMSGYFITTGDVRSHFVETGKTSNDELWSQGRNDLMPIVCAECGSVYDRKPWGRRVMAGEMSHGLCSRCVDIVAEREGVKE